MFIVLVSFLVHNLTLEIINAKEDIKIKKYEKISTIFPDEIFAKTIADDLSKDVDDYIQQSDLDDVYCTAFLHIPNGVKSLEGIRYLYALGRNNYNNSQIMANGVKTFENVSDLENLYAPYLAGIQVGASNIKSAGWKSLLVFLGNNSPLNGSYLYILNVQEIGLTNKEYAELANVKGINKYLKIYAGGNHYDNFDVLENYSVWNYAQSITMNAIHINQMSFSFTNPSKDFIGLNGGLPLKIISKTDKEIIAKDNSTIIWITLDIDRLKDSIIVYTTSLSRKDNYKPDVRYTIPLIWDELSVKASYKDTKGEEISKNNIIKGIIGDSFIFEQKDIEGYTFKKVVGETSGIINGKDQNITYYYTENNEDADTKSPLKKEDKKRKEIYNEKKINKKMPKTGSSDILNISFLLVFCLCNYQMRKFLKYAKTNKETIYEKNTID